MAKFKKRKPIKASKPKATKTSKPAPQAFDDCNSKACAKDAIPHCGSDGVTYIGSCGMKGASCKNPSLTFTNGPCPKQTPAPRRSSDCDLKAPCAMDAKPYCGSDGVTYIGSCGRRNASCKNPSLTFTNGSCPKQTPSQNDD